MLYRLLSLATNIAQLRGLLLSVFHFSEESRRSLRTTEIYSVKLGFLCCPQSLLNCPRLGLFSVISHSVLCAALLVSNRYIAILNNIICRLVPELQEQNNMSEWGFLFKIIRQRNIHGGNNRHRD